MRVNTFAGNEDIYTFLLFPGFGGTIAPGWRVQGYFSTGNSEPMFTKDFLVDSDADRFGERSCYHYALDGDVTALPSGTMSVSNITILHHFRDTKPTVIVPRWTWQTRKGSYTSVNGPMLFTRGKINFSYRFPDFHAPSLVSAHVRNIEVVIRTIKPDCYVVTGHMELSRNPNNPSSWTSWDYHSVVKVDRVRKICTRDDGPTDYLLPIYKVLNSVDTPKFSLSAFPHTAESYRNTLGILERKFIPSKDDYVYGDLVRRCANDARTISTNSIELVTELAGISATLRSILGLATGNVNAKTIASAYLTYKYGPRLTGLGLKTVLEGLGKRVRTIDGKHSRTRAKTSFVLTPVVGNTGHLNVTYCYKMIYATYTNDVRDFLKSWFNSGLFPSLTNAWDLVPLSFVLDWFFEVESFLDGIDANTYWSLHQIVDVVYSKKQVFSGVNWLFSGAGYTLVGDMSFKYYERNVASSAHPPLFFDPSPHEFKNYAELTSLIIANRR